MLDTLSQMGVLSNDATLLLSYWTPEFNPDHSAFGLHFIHKYIPQGKVYDTCETGSLTAFAALHITSKIGKSHLQGTANENVVILGMEQNTIPRDLKDGYPIPIGASVGSIVLSTDSTQRSGRLYGADILSETQCLEDKFTLRKFVLDLCNEYNFSEDELLIFIPYTNFLAKKWRYDLSQKNEKDDLFTVCYLPYNSISSMHTFDILSQIMRGKDTQGRRFILFIDEAIQTLSLGWFLVEPPKPWRKKELEAHLLSHDFNFKGV